MSLIWTACSRTACPCSATTTRRRPRSATYSRWPNAGTRARPRTRRTAGPGSTPWPAGPACGAWPRPSASGRAPTRPVSARPRRASPSQTRWLRRRRPARPARLAGGRRHHPRAARGPPARGPAQAGAALVAAVLGLELAAARDLLGAAACGWSARAALAVVETAPARSSPGSPVTTSCCSVRRSAANWSARRRLPPLPPHRRARGVRLVAGHGRHPRRTPGHRGPPGRRPWRWPMCPRARGGAPARPAGLPHGPQGPRGPPRPAPRACRDDDGRGRIGGGAGARALGRLSRGSADRRGRATGAPSRPARRKVPTSWARTRARRLRERRERAGRARLRFTAGSRSPDVSVEVIGPAFDEARGRARTVDGRGAARRGHDPHHADRVRWGARGVVGLHRCVMAFAEPVLRDVAARGVSDDPGVRRPCAGACGALECAGRRGAEPGRGGDRGLWRRSAFAGSHGTSPDPTPTDPSPGSDAF